VPAKFIAVKHLFYIHLGGDRRLQVMIGFVRSGRRKTTVAELQKSAADPNQLGFGKEFVEEVKACVREGDELWWYESPQEFLAGEAGIVVIRDGEIVSQFVTMDELNPTTRRSAWVNWCPKNYFKFENLKSTLIPVSLVQRRFFTADGVL
jgi:hypothetical protein